MEKRYARVIVRSRLVFLSGFVVILVVAAIVSLVNKVWVPAIGLGILAIAAAVFLEVTRRALERLNGPPTR